MIKKVRRDEFIQRIQEAFETTPICALLGPRQCGKTTLSRLYAEKIQGPVHIFDLEDPGDLARLENAKLTLEALEGLIIIDEVQLHSSLFPLLRVLVDKYPQKFLLLGSASPELIRNTSETLAGRITYIEMTPFSLQEVDRLRLLWERGGYPRSYLASTFKISSQWRKGFINTFLEKDIPQLGFEIAPQMIRRFWMMLCHYHGGIFNASEIGISLGISHKTVKHYLDILEGTYMMRRLNPWFENIGKRQVKSPKIYFRDSGLFHTLLGIESEGGFSLTPKLGASFEGFALEEIARLHQTDPQDCYFWRTQGGAELDLLIVKSGQKLGFEIKYTDHPKLTKSMQFAMEDLKLDKLTVIVPGTLHFPLAERMEVCGLETYVSKSPSPSVRDMV